MIRRVELEQWLRETFSYEEFSDFCANGLQVEGADTISRVVCGVSLNTLLLDKAVEMSAEAILVHHGFFGKDFLRIAGPLRQKLVTLLNHNISVFGIHLPLDAHPEVGNNAVLLSWIGAENRSPLNVGYRAENSAGHSLDNILKIYSRQLGEYGLSDEGIRSELSGRRLYGFEVYPFGPEIPRRIACISGGASSLLSDALAAGCDTFICGETKEHIPAMAMDYGINYINLGHYRSEKAGIMALRDALSSRFDAEFTFIDIPNPI